MVLNGPITAAWFRIYAEQVLAPTLLPGNVAILDNLPAQRGPVVRRAVDVRGVSLLFLPSYSPDFNPAENAFAKLKALLRKAAARTITDLRRVIGESLNTFLPAECAKYLTAIGYEPE